MNFKSPWEAMNLLSIAIAGVIIAIIGRGCLLYLYWMWFVVVPLNVAQLPIYACVGLSGILMSMQSGSNILWPQTSDEAIDYLIAEIGRASFVLCFFGLFGYLLHFMVH